MPARPAVLAVLMVLGGCRSRGDQGVSPVTGEASVACEAPAPGADPRVAPACELPAPAGLDPAPTSSSVLGRPLAPCSSELKTGWFRDGFCHTDSQDHGVHVVCAQVTDEFLQFSRSRGNDLITPHPETRFPGLHAGDHWCLCAERWKEALEAGVAPPVVPDATHAKALRYVSQPALLERTAKP